jgi:hypothetical protein
MRKGSHRQESAVEVGRSAREKPGREAAAALNQDRGNRADSSCRSSE